MHQVCETLMSTYSQGLPSYFFLGLGACGISNTAADPIVAVGWQTFDSFP